MIKVLHRQSLLDIAIQHTGTVANAFAIAVANGMAVSDVLEPGAELIVPQLDVDRDISDYYRSRNLKPATAMSAGIGSSGKRGIGWMQIGVTFKVS